MAERLVAKRVSRDRLAVVRNWVDLDRSSACSRARAPTDANSAFDETARVALYSGSIGAKQGFDELIEAARRLARRADIIFVIAGEGPAKPSSRRASPIWPNVRLLPFQPAARLAEFLRPRRSPSAAAGQAEAADLVLPSKLGGMLASGRRIVVDRGGRDGARRLPRRGGHSHAARRRGGAGQSNRARR